MKYIKVVLDENALDIDSWLSKEDIKKIVEIAFEKKEDKVVNTLEKIVGDDKLAKEIVIGSVYVNMNGDSIKVDGIFRHTETRDLLVAYSSTDSNWTDYYVTPIKLFLENIKNETIKLIS